ncbi:MAG: DUF4388 domain-containing protein [Actinomycetota bacterium]
MLKGTLDDFSLPDIFRLTALAKKTGRLEVERRTGSGRVYFRDGEVYYAESTKSKEPLGRKLIRSGWVTERQLRRAVVEQEQTGRRVGEILVGQGAVDDEQIEWAVRSQIEDGVFDLLRWDLGAFVWEPDVEIEVEVPLTVTVENLIIEASRRLDEISQIKKKIPSADVVLAMSARPPDGAHQINITSEEWQVLVLVDGHRTVEEIATTTGAEAYQTTRLLFGLMNAGLIEHRQVPIGSSDETERHVSGSERDWQRGAGSAGPQNGGAADRWHESDDRDSNVVELQRDLEDDVETDVDAEVDAEIQSDEERPAMTTPPAPPPSPVSEPEVSEREPVPPPSPRRTRGPRVDRSAVVRELAGLFNEGNKPRPRAVPSGEDDEGKHPEPTQKRRVEDDDQVDRKLIGRMIDGVKGL